MLALPAGAIARSPLKSADMKTIRKDAKTRARAYAVTYHARANRTSCRRTTPYTARCRLRMIGARSGARRHNCTITTVYAVVGDSIAGSLAHDGCA